MRTTQALTITLPHEMAQLVKQKVASGDYASDSEVLRDGLRALQARDEAMDAWLREEVRASMAELAANPDKVMPLDGALARIKANHRKA